MKFIELKKNLTGGVKKCYLLEGEDRFVVNNALSLIEKKVNILIPEVNRVVIDNESGTLDDLLFQLESFPFGEEKKLIIVRDFQAKENLKKLEEQLKNLPDFIVLVFMSFSETTLTKLVKKYAEFVDCSKLDVSTIKSWIGGQISKAKLNIEDKALEKLVLFTNLNMARVETETLKLISMGEAVITEELVDKFVVRDREYQIYELTEFLAKGESEKAYDMVNTMLQTEKNSVGLVQFIYSSFRKLLLISLSRSSDEELAKVFKVKPYSIKMSRLQAGKFTPKSLKRINEELSKLEFDLKSGRANQETAPHIIVAKILQAR